MKNRCNNSNNRFYHRYGGRGIHVCAEWNAFTSFMEWALSHGYADSLTLDRIDNDGNYCPDNCKWSTQHEQSLNKKHLLNKCGHKGIRISRRNGKVCGYKAVLWNEGKEVYLGFSKSLDKAIEIQEEGENRVRNSRR